MCRSVHVWQQALEDSAGLVWNSSKDQRGKWRIKFCFLKSPLFAFLNWEYYVNVKGRFLAVWIGILGLNWKGIWGH